jgi:nucleotide-binding universal stress UspA family protein
MYRKILVPVDLDDATSVDTAMSHAVELARRFGSELNLLTVVPDFGLAMVAQYVPQDYKDRVIAEARSRLNGLARDYVPEAVRCNEIVGHGRVYEEILRIADEVDSHLIVMAAKRPDLSDYLLGPNAARVVRHGNRSVLVVREPATDG